MQHICTERLCVVNRVVIISTSNINILVDLTRSVVVVLLTRIIVT